MNRNSESHFSNIPTIGISRSKFDRSFDHKTTFNTGDLIPVYVDTTIMPGDTVKMNMSEVVRMMTPIAPVMDNANLDIYFFFVPNRLIWNHWKRFMGENDTAPWKVTQEYEIPQIVAPHGETLGATGWNKGSLADYMGYPTEVPGYSASALPFRAYALIWNEWFRDQNLQNPQITDSELDTNRAAVTKTSAWAIANAELYQTIKAVCGSEPLKVCKYHDYFTSCLPEPQKGPSVVVPLGQTAPVVYNNSEYTGTTPPSGWAVDGKQVRINAEWNGSETATYPGLQTTKWGTEDTDRTGDFGPIQLLPTDTTSTSHLYSNLMTDLSQAVGATVNQLRQAFAIQKFYEKQALGGTRYIEMIKAHFNVTNPDYRMQRPEYLGGKRIPINMNQVVQTNPTENGSTPLGTTGAFSITADRDEMFTHSFTEHGILMGLATVRTVHTYQQGLNRQFSKKKFTDFYFPVFANLGNQAVLNKEIFMVTPNSEGEKNEEAFGYQEAWATERYFPDIVTGEMRSNYSQSLDIWHYADDYDTLPNLGDEWIQETDENVGRTLAVQSHDQFFGDFYFKAIYTRPMPLYSIPGLIDHH